MTNGRIDGIIKYSHTEYDEDEKYTKDVGILDALYMIAERLEKQNEILLRISDYVTGVRREK